MTQTLPQVGHEHHERLLLHVNEMPEMADRALIGEATEVKRTLLDMSTFLTGMLVPHVDAAEAALYPELERMLQNRHSMSPMRREHAEIRRLVGDFVGLVESLEVHPITIGRTLALRRVIYPLYALLKIHLAEEEAYLRVVDHGVATDVADMLAAAMNHPGIPTA